MHSYYPESKVEITGFTARHYDTLLDLATFGRYLSLIEKSVKLMGIEPGDRILDLGTGTGRNAFLMAKYLSEKGRLIGLDISLEMIFQFKRKCASFPNIKVIQARADKLLPFKQEFDKVFISFVLHGFPQNVREGMIKGVFDALKVGGSLFILDYNEFSYNEMPFYLKVPFKLIECPYAFDFIERDWKEILINHHFADVEEFFFFRDYVRLLKVKKVDGHKEKRGLIAIPTDDGINIFQGMLGRAKEIFIYEMENGGTFRLIEKRKNPYANTMQHLETLDVYEMISDCQIILSSHIGEKGVERLEGKGMKLFFEKGKLEKALPNIVKKIWRNTSG
jgi:ubiquinone/menaquinone biosynthesis C-methylase UbiE/predicted Fe-Mo cluster-binding NifX family protein